MNGYNLVMKIQEKMKDPQFVSKFNEIVAQFNGIPGLKDEVLRISQIKDEKKRDKALERLPDNAKKLVKDLNALLNN